MSLPDVEQEYAGKPKRSRRKKLVIALAILLSILAIGGIAGGFYLNNLRASFDDNKTVVPEAFPSNRPTPSLQPDYDGQTILMIGSDSRVSVDSNEAADQRADSILLVNIPTDRSKIYVTSIMRDTYVPIPGYGEDKINSAMSKGGIPLLVETLESLTDARIDHVASVDFEGFKSLTESLGGVTLNNPTAFTAQEGDVYPAGEITLEGDYALNYVRERKAFINSDYQRVENQQNFLHAIFKGLTSAGTLSNPVKLQDTVKSFAPYLTTDKDLTSEKVASIAVSLKDISSDDIETFTLNNQGTGETSSGESIVLPDLAAFQAYGEAVNTDGMEDYPSFALGTTIDAPTTTPTESESGMAPYGISTQEPDYSNEAIPVQ